MDDLNTALSISASGMRAPSAYADDALDLRAHDGKGARIDG
ncbi:MAG: hypothetical protein ACKVS5_01430 [Parvularculaceae bacterium]